MSVDFLVVEKWLRRVGFWLCSPRCQDILIGVLTRAFILVSSYASAPVSLLQHSFFVCCDVSL